MKNILNINKFIVSNLIFFEIFTFFNIPKKYNYVFNYLCPKIFLKFCLDIIKYELKCYPLSFNYY